MANKDADKFPVVKGFARTTNLKKVRFSIYQRFGTPLWRLDRFHITLSSLVAVQLPANLNKKLNITSTRPCLIPHHDIERTDYLKIMPYRIVPIYFSSKVPVNYPPKNSQLSMQRDADEIGRFVRIIELTLRRYRGSAAAYWGITASSPRPWTRRWRGMALKFAAAILQQNTDLVHVWITHFASLSAVYSVVVHSVPSKRYPGCVIANLRFSLSFRADSFIRTCAGRCLIALGDKRSKACHAQFTSAILLIVS